jgi:hypothetical protein
MKPPNNTAKIRRIPCRKRSSRDAEIGSATLARLIDGVSEENSRTNRLQKMVGAGNSRASCGRRTDLQRYRQMIENSGVTLMGFDQNQRATLGDYNSWNVQDAL